MIIEERFTIAAPVADVWAFFLDVPRSSACMPGVDGVEPVDGRGQNYRGRIQVKVGPLRAGFAMEVELAEARPPEHLALVARGTDRGTSSMVQANVTVRLAPASERGTEVAYAMELAIRGALGRFGQTVIRDTARKMSEQFVACAERALATSDAAGASDG